MEKNRAFEEMFRAAKAMLAGKDPVVLAQNAGAVFDGTSFLVPSLGKAYSFSYPEYVCTTLPLDWHYLVLLHYLNLADGTPMIGEPISFSELPAGLVRGTKYDRTAAESLAVFLKGKSEAQLAETVTRLGGRRLPGKADFCCRLPSLPNFPVYLNIWFDDEEFPPSGKLLVDRSAGHYLTIEDAVTVGEIVLLALRNAA